MVQSGARGRDSTRGLNSRLPCVLSAHCSIGAQRDWEDERFIPRILSSMPRFASWSENQKAVGSRWLFTFIDFLRDTKGVKCSTPGEMQSLVLASFVMWPQIGRNLTEITVGQKRQLVAWCHTAANK